MKHRRVILARVEIDPGPAVRAAQRFQISWRRGDTGHDGPGLSLRQRDNAAAVRTGDGARMANRSVWEPQFVAHRRECPRLIITELHARDLTLSHLTARLRCDGRSLLAGRPQSTTRMGDDPTGVHCECCVSADTRQYASIVGKIPWMAGESCGRTMDLCCKSRPCYSSLSVTILESKFLAIR